MSDMAVSLLKTRKSECEYVDISDVNYLTIVVFK